MPLASLHNFIIDILNNAVWQRLWTDEAFAEGFTWALVLTLGVGTFSRFALFYLNKIMNPIRAFFKATREPATNPGPSAADRFWGCLGSILLVILTTAGIAACMGIS